MEEEAVESRSKSKRESSHKSRQTQSGDEYVLATGFKQREAPIARTRPLKEPPAFKFSDEGTTTSTLTLPLPLQEPQPIPQPSVAQAQPPMVMQPQQPIVAQQLQAPAPAPGKIPEAESEYSFPRIAKAQKKPKRNQEGIPKKLFVGRTKEELQALNPHPRSEQPPIPFPPKVEDGDVDIARLLFEYASDMDTDMVDKALTELSQVFLKSHAKAKEAVELGGHGIIIVTMKK